MADQNLYGFRDGDNFYHHYPSFLRLFRYEFDSLLEDDTFRPEYFANLRECLSQKHITTLSYHINEENVFAPEDGRILHKALSYVDNEHTSFWTWLQKKLLEHVPKIKLPDGVPASKHYRQLEKMLTGPPDTEHENFAILFNDQPIKNKLDCIVELLMVDEFTTSLKELDIQAYNDLLEEFDRNKKKKEFAVGFHYAASDLLRSMIYSRPDKEQRKSQPAEDGDFEIVDSDMHSNETNHSWYMDFLYTCTKNVRNATILAYIDPQFDVKLDQYVTSLKAYAEKGVYTDIVDTIDPTESHSFRKPDIAINDEYFQDNLADAEEAEGNKLNLRGYQAELSQFANEGINTVICAPTGSGKTIVAIDIIQKHLDRRNILVDCTIEQRSRVVFVVPTVPLVNQQRKLIAAYLNSKYTTIGISGGSHQDMNVNARKILDSHVVVMTPQMLVNALQTVDNQRRLYISDFTLFILDECHHCGQKHPYEILMKMVREYVKKIDKQKLDNEKPQVVGLTASIGTRRGETPAAVTQHIFQLCVNMLATQISTIRNADNLFELYKYVNPPDDDIKPASRPKDDLFRDQIYKLVEQVIEYIYPDLVTAKANIDRLKDFNVDMKVSDPNFRNNFVERLIEVFKQWKGGLDEERMRITTATDHLRIYCYALLTNDLLPAYFAYQYMKEKFQHLLGNVPHDDELGSIYWNNEENLETLAKDCSVRGNKKYTKKDILTRLVDEVLVNAYRDNKDTRAMIFVQTRATAHYMSDFLNACGALKEYVAESKWGLSRALVSTNPSKNVGGMSQSDQRATIAAFASGHLKILVVTSVAEEGLDISACNLIVKYNTVGSERTMIQRRGRARQMHSKSVLLCLDGELENREIQNISREQLLKECLDNLQAKSARQLASSIEEERQEMYKKEEKLQEEQDRSDRQLEPFVYNLMCKKCHRYLCTSKEMRSVLDSHFCCVTERIWDNVDILPADAPSSDAFFVTCGPIACKGIIDEGNETIKCNQILGNVVRSSDIYLPSFKHLALSIQERNSTSDKPEIFSGLTWKNMKQKFLIYPIKVEDLLGMSRALEKHSSKDYQRVKEEAIYAIERKVQKIKEKKARRIKYNLAEYGEK